ncbi:tyrosine-protein kinase domain-containing protein [Afifella marina]|uniref:non-specific protein-tyrosine kinase n=1 Tax=Afifella marina DSM 2698 TaxID=1120955 RepID=A0A1G5NXR6_AFIMA|nr:tyrosine-protein kinase domain-containing protein [Afifella marina]SCZ42123.1 capsular exopolysaccharide family [Afifella marina DSM 2698]
MRTDPLSIAGAQETPTQAGVETGAGSLLWMLGLLVRRKWVVVLVAAVVFMGMAAVIAKLTPSYRATALVLLPSVPVDDPRTAEEKTVSPMLPSFIIASEAAVLGSEEVARRVIETLDLQDEPSFAAKPSWRTRLRNWGASFFGGNEVGASAWSADELERDRLLQIYMKKLSTYNDGLSTAALISFTWSDPHLAAKIVNAHAATYIGMQVERRTLALQHVVDLLSAQMQERRADVEAATHALSSAQAASGGNSPLVASVSGSGAASVAGSLPDLQSDLDRARGALAQTQSRLVEATSRLHDGQLQSADFVADDAKVVSRASVPTRQIFPKVVLFLLVAAIVSLAAGLAVAMVVDHLASRWRRNAAQVESIGLPILGAISLNVSSRLSSNRGIRVRFWEEIRFVRNRLLHESGKPARVVLVVSAMPREGKSLAAAALAQSFAATGRRVLLLDADLRHGAGDHACVPSLGKTGLSDLLGASGGKGRSGQRDAIMAVEGTSLHVLAAGNAAGSDANAIDALASPVLPKLIEALRRDYDVIVIDSPPLNVVSDATSLATLADQTLLLCHIGRFSPAALDQTITLLRACRAEISGVVLTGNSVFAKEGILRHGAPVPSRAQKGLTKLRPTLTVASLVKAYPTPQPVGGASLPEAAAASPS